MKEEIKEILAYFEEYIKITDMHDSEPMLNWKDLKIVLDYITNLQAKVKLLTTGLEATDKAYKDYKSRIDKAISLLKEAGCYDEETKTFCDDVWEELPDLLNILQGSDDNE